MEPIASFIQPAFCDGLCAFKDCKWEDPDLTKVCIGVKIVVCCGVLCLQDIRICKDDQKGA